MKECDELVSSNTVVRTSPNNRCLNSLGPLRLLSKEQHVRADYGKHAIITDIEGIFSKYWQFSIIVYVIL